MRKKSPVTYDANSFIIEGERHWLRSGSMHYWRTPRGRWRDRLEKAKSFGLNCIQTYVNWGLHEPEPGEFHFDDELDLDGFLALCAELELFVIARPGPYICAEVSMGGFPAWMLEIRGLEFRRTNSLYLEQVDRWFEELVPIFAKRQAGRDGTVILYQIENELGIVRRSETDQKLYMDHLRATVQRLGIHVPIITCAGSAEGALECINSHTPADQFTDIRTRQPNAPLFSTEFWPFWYHTWEDHPDWQFRTPEELAYQTWRVLAEGGAGYNYYMWHGGTNFGWSAMYGQTTNYGHITVLEESGEVQDRYRVTALCARAAQALESALAASSPVESSLKASDSALQCFAREGEKGQIAFVLNPTEKARSARLTTPWGRKVKVDVPAMGCRTLLAGAQLDGGLYVERSSAHVHCVVPGKNGWIVAVASPPLGAAHEFVCGVNGETVSIPVNAANKLAVSSAKLGKKTVTVAVIPAGAEHKIHPLSNRLAVGADWIGETASGITMQVSTSKPRARVIGDRGHTRLLTATTAKPPVWTLGAWSYAQADVEADPSFDDSRWPLDLVPLSMDLQGDHDGYAWYRSRFELERERVEELYLSAFADRVNVYLNGSLIHQSSPPPEDRPTTPSARIPLGQLPKGTYHVAVLAENMGHVKGEWQINARGLRDVWMHDDLKGLLGPVFINGTRPVEPWTYRAGLSIEDDFGLDPERVDWKPLGPGRGRGMRYFRTLLTCKGDPLAAPVYLVLNGLTKGLLWLNGRLVGRVWPERDYVEQWLPDGWLERRNEIVLLEESPATPNRVRVRQGPLTHRAR